MIDMSLIRIETDTMRGIAEQLQGLISPIRNNVGFVEDIWTCISNFNINISGVSDLKLRMTHNDTIYSLPNSSDERTKGIQVVADAIMAIIQRGANADSEVCLSFCDIINDKAAASGLLANMNKPTGGVKQPVYGVNDFEDRPTGGVKQPVYGVHDFDTTQPDNSNSASYDPNALLGVYQQMFGDAAYNVITQALTNGDSLTPELEQTLVYLQNQLSTQTASVSEMQASANNNSEHGGYLDNYNNYVNNNGGTFNDPAYSIGGSYFEMMEMLEQQANQYQGTGYPTYQDNYTATVNESNAASGMNGGEMQGTVRTSNTTNDGNINFLNAYLTNSLNGSLNPNDLGVSYMSSNGGLGGAITIIDSLVEAYNNGTLNPNDPAISYLQNTYGVDTSALIGASGGTATVQENNASSGYIDNGVELVFGDNSNNNGLHDPYFDYYGNQDSGNNYNNGFHDPYFDYYGDQGNQNNNFHDPYFDYFGDNGSNAQTFTFQDPYNSYYTQEQNNNFQNYYSNQGQPNGFQDPYYSYYGIPEPSPYLNEFQQAWDANVQNGTARADDPGAAYFNWKYGADFHI